MSTSSGWLAPDVSMGLRLTPAVSDAPNFRALYEAHAAFVWRSVRRLGVRPGDLEDACQEVFVIAHKKLGEFDGTSPRGWLFAIAARVAADHRKRAHVRHEAPTFPMPEVASHASMERVAQSEARELLQRLLDELDPTKREVFILFELEEMPMTEVAVALGCPLQTAYARLHSARKALSEAATRLRAKESR